MPTQDFKLKPGVDVESSAFVASLQLNTSNLIRFYGGRVQPLGGWGNINSGQLFVGTCRGLHGWADVPGNPYLAVGTEQRLEVFTGGQMQDITPVITTTNPAVSFTTVSGQTAVTITDAGAAPAVGDWINLLTQVSVGGIVLFGFYQVTALGGANQYVVNAASPATGNVTNGGAVPAYTTTNTQPTVSVLLNNHGYVSGTGGTFNAAVSTTVATIVISGLYAITSVTDANHFVITAISTANASTTASENAGNARIQYLLPSGQAVNVGLTGFGAGDYGGGDFGGFTGGATITIMRQWFLDHFGQSLIAMPANGKIYTWLPPTIVPATVVSGSAPTASAAMFVMPQSEQIMALGAEVGGTQQPLLARWCDAGDFTAWTALTTNLAGSYSFPSGSGLIGGLAVGMGACIWTDISLTYVTFIGFPLVWNFNPIAMNCGLLAARCAGNIGPLVMWLGKDQFFRYVIGGGVEPIECSVWDFYFNNMDFTQAGQAHCAVNGAFTEFTWHFPLSTASPLWSALAPMGYVKYNAVEQAWDYGLSSQYQRTAWIPRSPMGNAIGADLNGLLQQHEVGHDADGSTMRWSWQSGYMPLAAGGEEIQFTDQLRPDFSPSLGMPTMTPNLLVTDFQNQPPTTVFCPAFSTSTTFLVYSARGRYLSIGFQAHGTALGTFWRLGNITIRTSPDGSGP